MFTQKELAEAITKSGLSRETPEGRVSLQLKRATDTIVSPSSGKTSPDFGIANPSWTQVLNELMPSLYVDGGAVTHYQMSTQGAADVVAEDGAKPQFSTRIGGETLTLATVAGIEKVSDEFLEDYGALMQSVDQLARTTKDIAVLGEIFGGNGTIQGLMRRNAIGQASVNVGAARNFESILNAIHLIMQRGFTPTAMVTYASILTSNLFKQAVLSYNLNYGSSTGQPGNTDPSVVGSPFGFTLLSFAPAFGAVRLHIAGIPVIVLPGYQSPGTVPMLIGDFARGAVIYRAGERVEIGRDGDDFSHDRITLRVSERVNIGLRSADAFHRLNLNSA